jgi:hypothetical protein
VREDRWTVQLLPTWQTEPVKVLRCFLSWQGALVSSHPAPPGAEEARFARGVCVPGPRCPKIVDGKALDETGWHSTGCTKGAVGRPPLSLKIGTEHTYITHLYHEPSLMQVCSKGRFLPNNPPYAVTL